MKKIVALLIVGLFIFCGCEKPKEKFYLEDKYYNNESITEIDGTKLKQLEDDQESFVVFVHLPYCSMLACFEPIMEEFIEDNQISFYSALSTKIDGTLLDETVEHFPTVAIYNKGKIVAYLDAKSDDDLKYFKDLDDFTSWIGDYIYFEKLD